MKRAKWGHAVIEIALMLPWILLLFIAVFNFGFYVYSAISVENAARAAALHTSSNSHLANDSTTACFYALQELQKASNVAWLPSNFSCTGAPLRVTAAATTVSGMPASQVTVTYQAVAGIPIPWFPGLYSITRVVSMRQSDENATP